MSARIEEFTMAYEERGRSSDGRGGFQRRPNWRDDNGGRNQGRGRGFERRDERGGDRGERSFDRGERREGGYRDRREGGYRDRREGGFRDGGRGRGFERRDERGGDRGERSFDRDGRREGGYRDRREGGFRDGGRGRGFERRDDRGGRSGDRRDFRKGEGQSRFSKGRGDDRFSARAPQGRNDRSRDTEYQNFSSTDEYISPDPNEPRIPAGVSAEELDAQALRGLATLSGPNKDIVARHLVMAGQLIDLDPEEAYKHAAAAAKRAGRVDVVREAAALTAYASGRYEEALREVRAVRRMRGDDSLRAVEADAERGLGHPEKAVEIIDKTSTEGMELSEQVELVLVSSGARADLGEREVALLIVDDALSRLPEDTDPYLVRRLMEVKIDRLRELGRDNEADEVEASLPEELEDPEIVDLSLFADADVDNKRTALRAMETALVEAFDTVLLDLDGTAWNGDRTIAHASESVDAVREAGMKTVFVTNNAMRTPAQVAQKLRSMGFTAEPEMVMTSAMDIIAIMKETLDEGAKVFVIGGAGLREALEDAGYVIVDSADDEPAAVVQGLDTAVDWTLLSEGAFAIQRGAEFYATNLDATLPQERGFALGNGSLVRAIEHATRKRPRAGGKPEPGIYLRAAALVDGEKPIAVGDRLETDISGAVSASMPAMHVLTGVHGARDVIRAPRGQRPSFLALDMRGLLEAHPRAKHHRDGTWTCGDSQVVKVTRWGALTVDDVELDENTPCTVTLDTYRALAAAGWDYADEKGNAVRCPAITVVENGDPSGVIEAPEPVESPEAPETDGGFDAGDEELALLADEVDEAVETPAFLPGEEELERLLAETADLDAENRQDDENADEPDEDSAE
ncbi:MAG: HAD-IIA family hydrolase [Schaalia hyovaginalis]|nr:HAD-IIA family hydrolase [Schaalia hyovaginalis]